MKLSRENLTLHTAAGKGHGRPAIEAIRCDREGTVSTDGFRLTIVPYPDGPAAEGDPAIGLSVPVEAVDRAAAAMRPSDEAIVSRAKDGRVEIAIASRGQATVGVRVLATPPAAEFPNWRAVVPAAFAVDVDVQPAYLMDALDVVRQLGCTSVRLRMNGPHEPVLIEGFGGQVLDPEVPVRVVVMPMFLSRRPDQAAS